MIKLYSDLIPDLKIINGTGGFNTGFPVACRIGMWAFFRRVGASYDIESGYNRDVLVKSIEKWRDRINNSATPLIVNVEEERNIQNAIMHDIRYVKTYCRATTKSPEETVQYTVDMYVQMLRDFHNILPSRRVGVYRIAPIRDYQQGKRVSQSSTGENVGYYRAWNRACDLVQPIANEADVLFPSLYWLNQSMGVEDYRKFVSSNLQQAERLAPHKELYVYLGREHYGDPRLATGERPPIGPGTAKAQVEVVRDVGKNFNVKGIVLFSEHDFPESDDWYAATKQQQSLNDERFNQRE